MAPTFARILVPLDGTAFAEAALIPACAMARAFNAHIVLVRSIEPSGLPCILPSPPTHPARGSRRRANFSIADDGFEVVDEADAYLHGVLDRLRSAGLRASMVLYLAEPGAAIAHTSEVRHADLIVMTAHPRWKTDLLDDTSTTVRVLARSRVSLLAWRVFTRAVGTAGDTLDDAVTAQTLLPSAESPLVVPLDGSPEAEEALPIAERLAATFGTYLILVRAVQAPPPNDTTMAEARDYLARIEAKVRQQGIGTSTFARFGSPVGVMDATCREFDASMVVMASHAGTDTGHRFLGSVAAHAIEDLAVPIFVVRTQPSDTPLVATAGSTAHFASILDV